MIRFATEWAIGAGIDIAQTLRLPLFSLSFGLLLAGLWANRDQPGLSLAFIGILLNTIAVVVNGGYMPVWDRAWSRPASIPTRSPPFHRSS